MSHRADIVHSRVDTMTAFKDAYGQPFRPNELPLTVSLISFGFNNSKGELFATMADEDWQTHDLRESFCSYVVYVYFNDIQTHVM